MDSVYFLTDVLDFSIPCYMLWCQECVFMFGLFHTWKWKSILKDWWYFVGHVKRVDMYNMQWVGVSVGWFWWSTEGPDCVFTYLNEYNSFELQTSVFKINIFCSWLIVITNIFASIYQVWHPVSVLCVLLSGFILHHTLKLHCVHKTLQTLPFVFALYIFFLCKWWVKEQRGSWMADRSREKSQGCCTTQPQRLLWNVGSKPLCNYPWACL